MVINLKDKADKIPRNEKGDPAFTSLDPHYTLPTFEHTGTPSLSEVFTKDEIVELVNRALYQIEYQKTSHRKRGQKLRDVEKALKEELKKQGLDVKVTEIKNQLEGKK